MVSRRIDIRQQRTVIPEEWETNEVSPRIAPLYRFESFEATKWGRKESQASSLS